MEVELLKSKKNAYAIVGASADREKYGNKVLLNLKGKGFFVIPVNPKGGEIEGMKAYPTITEAKKDNDIDVVVFVIPPERTIAVLEEMKSLGLNDAWFQPGSESEDASDYCDANGINCVMNACIMVETDKTA